MTQHQKILELLNDGEWHCTSFMYARFIADPRTRLSELKKQGHNLQSRWCENPQHKHDGQMKEWKLVDNELSIENRKVDNVFKTTATTDVSYKTCCPSWIIFKEHAKTCSVNIKKENVLF